MKLTNVSSRFGFGITGRGRSSVDRSLDEWAREVADRNAKHREEETNATVLETSIPISQSQKRQPVSVWRRSEL